MQALHHLTSYCEPGFRHERYTYSTSQKFCNTLKTFKMNSFTLAQGLINDSHNSLDSGHVVQHFYSSGQLVWQQCM